MEKIIIMAYLSLLGVSKLPSTIAVYVDQCHYALAKVSTKKVLGGVISMENMILHVTLDDPLDQIQSVSIYNEKDQLVYQGNGCGTVSCSYNCGDLPLGSYEVSVQPLLNSPFLGTIILE